ncbi:DegT/DnrJ/EryC1/StrS family aminotransferase [Streptomyces sp. NPDC057555]|uniref:DegT/DnrJ/EryC1/StrS family aminotransferase n=1 Tax=Streptomyces sp. NPDC057555 TaxID=3346166 RepID=UPI00369B4CEF
MVEDAAHTFGSSCGDTSVGVTKKLTRFSFGLIKYLSCEHGGAVAPCTGTERWGRDTWSWPRASPMRTNTIGVSGT